MEGVRADQVLSYHLPTAPTVAPVAYNDTAQGDYLNVYYDQFRRGGAVPMAVAGAAEVNGGDDADFLMGGTYTSNTLNAGEGNDWIYGEAARQVEVPGRSVNINAGAGSDFITTMGLNDTHAIDAGDGDDYVAINPFGRPHALALFVPQTNGSWTAAQKAMQARRAYAA